MAGPLDFLLGTGPDAAAKASALERLMQQRQLGILNQYSGDKVLAPIGRQMVQDVGAQEQAQALAQHQQAQLAQQAAQTKEALNFRNLQFGETQRHNLATETNAAKRTVARPTGGLGGGSSPDVKATGDAIIAGTLPPPTETRITKQGLALQGYLARQGFDLTTATREYKAVKDQLHTLNGPQQNRLRQSIVSAMDITDNIDKLYQEWKTVAPVSGFKVFNKASIASAKQMPGEAGAIAQALEAQIADLTSDLGSVYQGGNSPTIEALKLAEKNLAANWNEETFKRATDLIRKNLKIRHNAILHAGVAGVNPGSKYLPSDQTSDQTDAAPAAPVPPTAQALDTAALRKKYGL